MTTAKHVRRLVEVRCVRFDYSNACTRLLVSGESVLTAAKRVGGLWRFGVRFDYSKACMTLLEVR